MADCVQKYLAEGLQEHTSATKDFKLAVNQVTRPLWEFLERYFDENEGVEQIFSTVYELYSKQTKGKLVSSNRFLQKAQIWAETKQMIIEDLGRTSFGSKKERKFIVKKEKIGRLEKK
jgi:hypothetical protein